RQSWKQRRLRPEREESLREVGAFPFVFVLEEKADVAPRLSGDPVAPGRERGVVVLGAAQAQIAPRCGRNDERGRIGDVIRVGGTERGVVRPQQRADLVVVPRLVAKLERSAMLARKYAKELR